MTAPGPESIWSYPTPPTLSRAQERVRVLHGGATVADSVRCLRVCETGHGPTYYVPLEDVAADVLVAGTPGPGCAFKGEALYHDVRGRAGVARQAAWSYPDPAPGWEAVAGHVAFYPGRVDRCLLDDEPAAGDVYGGWITSRVEGPFRLAEP